jgi:hypothetical protein
MPSRSKVETLPREVRAWLDKALADNGFAKYELLAAQIKAKGYALSKSSLHRHGEKLEKRLAAVRASTEAARLIADALPDEADHRSAAVMSMVQTDIFEALVDLQDASANDAERMEPAERLKLMAKVGRTLAPMVGASIRLKKFSEDVTERARAAADKAAKLAQKGGLSKATVEDIRREILGIAKA